MVLTRAFACAMPVVASDIPGYRDVMTPETGAARSRPATCRRSPRPSWRCSTTSRGARRWARAGRRLAQERYSWDAIAGASLERSTSAVAGMKLRARSGAAAVERATRSRIAIVFIGGRRRAALVARAELGAIGDAFTVVRWEWVAVAVGLNLALGRRPRDRVATR